MTIRSKTIANEAQTMRQNNDASCFLFKNAFTFTNFPLSKLKATVSSRGHTIFQQTTDNVTMFQDNANEDDPTQQDKKRIQLKGLDIPKVFRTEYSHVRDILTKAFDQCGNYEIYPEAILFSEEGCIAQSYHFDYDPDNVNTRHCFVALIGFEDNTTLETISIVDDIELEKQISFNKGDLLLFRGDFIHAGSSYINSNVRLHFYIEPK
jgi:ectoine hydroxylase-related dioxygenase (phytanoyl-CoA dioxygenase family)